MHIKLCIDPTKCETKFVRLLLYVHFKIVTFTLEKCLFSVFLNVFLTYCLKIEECLVNYRKIIK